MTELISKESLVQIVRKAKISGTFQAYWELFLPTLTPETEVFVGQGEIPAAALADTYEIRGEMASEKGMETFGYPETAQALYHWPDGVIVIGAHTKEYHAVLLLTPSLDKVVGIVLIKNTAELKSYKHLA